MESTTASLDASHSLLNGLFLWQTIAALHWCIIHRRWVHLPHRNIACLDCRQRHHTKGPSIDKDPIPDPNSIYLKQFQLQLVAHAAFYIYELATSDMHSTFQSMALHHYVAFLIFLTYINDIGSISVTTLLPFLLHSLFWVLYPSLSPTQNFLLLATYNLTLYTVGFICLLNSFSLTSWDALVFLHFPSLSNPRNVANRKIHPPPPTAPTFRKTVHSSHVSPHPRDKWSPRWGYSR
ncbi:hypothetical protein HDU98_000380 [Podochytrium sp. JEL0797]|nr:hypothetical protein HDU98_000380 [Podochytrium sp. JEL0797]